MITFSTQTSSEGIWAAGHKSCSTGVLYTFTLRGAGFLCLNAPHLKAGVQMVCEFTFLLLTTFKSILLQSKIVHFFVTTLKDGLTKSV